jgi:hypothetical protein
MARLILFQSRLPKDSRLPDGEQIANSQPIYGRRQPGHLHIQKSSKPAV